MSGAKIVSLLAGGTEIVCALERSRDLLGISHECDYPPEILDRPRVTRARVDSSRSSREIDEAVRAACASSNSLYEIDAPALRQLGPDVIVTQAHCEVCAVNYEDVVSLTRGTPELANTRILALNPANWKDIFEDIRRVARAIGAHEEGEALLGSLTRRVEAIGQRTEGLATSERPRIVCIEWIDPVMVAANWTPEWIEIAGGRCDLTRAGERSRYTDWNELRRFDPEVIVVMPCGFDVSRTERELPALLLREGWSDLSAVRNGRVFMADGNALFNRSGPRVVDSLELLAAVLHPGKFPELVGRTRPHTHTRAHP